MIIVTGVLKPTLTIWLPVLVHILPSSLRREVAIIREYNHAIMNPDLPIYEDLQKLPKCCFKSRNPFWLAAEDLKTSGLSPKDKWWRLWENSEVKNQNLITDLTDQPPGFTMPHKIWVTANCIRTSYGCCSHVLHKWKMKNSPICDCGEDIQTVEHLVNCYPTKILPWRNSFDSYYVTRSYRVDD
nr:PREDICTED: uncharacterized protein LOC106703989 [Latimeria chalumnae]|eukprot:XP_014345499.1 PREDICTED: uncharacterized protein LOC106703989 [Latimeria chalumnae]